MIGVSQVTAGPLLQPDGKILVSACLNGQVAVLRFLADGTPDESFGVGGAVVAPAAGTGFSSIAAARRSSAGGQHNDPRTIRVERPARPQLRLRRLDEPRRRLR